MQEVTDMKQLTMLFVLAAIAAPFAARADNVSAPKSLALTVYNSNFALVKDVRTIDLKQGVTTVEVQDVAAQIDATSVLFKSLTNPNSVTILEQNYQYDLISPDNILNKSTGERVTFTNFDETGQAHTYTGTILAPPSNGGLVIKTDDGEIVLRPQGQVSLLKMPVGLHPKPTLSWMIDSDRAGRQDAEISYITNGISWSADYVALVNSDDSALDLAGWVTMNNQSGATYDNAKLTLMAGDVRRISPGYGLAMDRSEVAGAMAYDGKPQFQEKSFFEYHMYSMERPTTIRDKETKQLSLLNASAVPVSKEMIYDGRSEWWNSWWYPGRTDYNPGGGYDTSNYHKVNVILQVMNSEKNHMGMPLPKGRIRVYKLDDTGSQQFIGEDQIDHTPKDEKIRLYIGDAFDVVGDYKRADYKKIANNVIEESFEVSIRNHKDKPVQVKSIDHVWSDWSVTVTSHEFTKKDAHTIEFPVTVPANGETKITYTIRTQW
jgi:hypothetical protein